MGATVIHCVIINVMAIVIEYFVIRTRFRPRLLLLRVILANLLSVMIGTIVIYTIPELIGGAVARPDDYVYDAYDQFALGVGLLCLFVTNVLIETPAYLIGAKSDKSFLQLVPIIFIANLITNVPVVLIYMMVVS